VVSQLRCSTRRAGNSYWLSCTRLCWLHAKIAQLLGGC